MFISGFILIYLQKNQALASKAQSAWMTMLTRKFILSLMLTPSCDNLIKVAFGNLIDENWN